MNPRKISLIIIIILCVVFVITLVARALIKTTSPVRIVERSILSIDLDRDYPEVQKFQFNVFTWKREIPFYRLIFAIESAVDDENIEAILLKGYNKLGLSRTWELRQALQHFKDAKKPIYGYFDIGGISNLLLASICDTVITCPQGTFYAPGLSAQMLFLKNTFAKLGIGFDVVQMGKYKGAGEMFTEDSMSVWLKESYNKLLDDLFGQILKDWSENTLIPQDSLKSIIDMAILDAKQAKKLGLVDTIVYWQEFKENLVGDNQDRLLSITKYVRTIPKWEKADTTIALVIADGSITTEVDKWSQNITSEKYSNIFRELADDDNISAIVFRVNSPGGSAMASDIIYNEITGAAEKKPVIVSMSSMAASGGYYISMPADTIFATPYTITGSIGVITLIPHFGEMYEKIGANSQKLKRGKHADIFSGDHPLTAEEREILTTYIQEIYHQFVEKASLGRDTTYQWIDSVAHNRYVCESVPHYVVSCTCQRP